MKSALKLIGVFLCVFALSAEGSFAFQTAGLGSPVGAGGLAMSTSLSYGMTDVKGGNANDDVESLRVLFRANFGIFNGFDLFGTVGFADAEFEDFDGSMGQALGAGLHYRMLSFPESSTEFMLELQADYDTSKDGTARVTRRGGQVATYLVRKIGAAGKIGFFYPYAGIRVSASKYYIKSAEDLKSDNLVGPFGGVDYFVNPNVYFSGEVHIIDENCVYLGVGYRF